METTAAGEVEDLFDDGTAGVDDLGLGVFQIVAVKHNQHTAVGCSRLEVGTVKATLDALVVKGDIVGVVVSELPAKDVVKKGLGGGDVVRGELYVVNLFVLAHGYLLPNWGERGCLVLW